MKRWIGITLIIQFSLLLLLLLLFTWLITSENGLKWGYKQAQPYIPGHLSIAQLNGRLIGPITITGIEYSLENQTASANKLVLNWHPFKLFGGHININLLHIDGLTVTLPPSSPKVEDKQFKLPDIKLPWRLKLEDVDIKNIQINQQEETFQITQLSLDASTLFSRINIKRLKLNAENFSIDLAGEFRPVKQYRHKLNIAWAFKSPQLDWLEGKGEIYGDIEKIKLTQYVTGPLTLNLSSEINNVLNNISWHAKANIDDIDTQRLDLNLPRVTGKLQLQGEGDLNTASITGSAEGHAVEIGAFNSHFQIHRMADNSLMIDKLALRTPATDTQLNAHGEWYPGSNGGDLNLALHWQKLRWPLQGTPWFDSAIGAAWINGNATDYQFGIATDQPWQQAPVSTWYGSATGNLDSMDIHRIRITLLEGEAQAIGRLDWIDQFHWQAGVFIHSINPAELMPKWPGSLHADIATSGGIQNGEFVADVNIIQLQGILRDNAISLRSQLGWREQGLDIDEFDLELGMSTLQVSGRLADSLSLEWTSNSPNLTELHPQAKGSLTTKGKLTGLRDALDVKINFNGNSLNLADYGIADIDGTVAVDLFRWQQLDLDINANNLKLKNQSLQSLKLNSTSNDGQHKLRADIQAKQINSTLIAHGNIQQNKWQGSLERADISTQQYGDWRLESLARLDIAPGHIRTEPICWLNNGGRACFEITHQDNEILANIEAMQLPLMLFTPWLPPDLEFEGSTNANANFKLQLPNTLRGTAHISLPKGALTYPAPGGERDRWQYQDGIIEIKLNDAGVYAKSSLSMGNGDQFEGKLELPNAELMALNNDIQTLRATAEMSVHKLELIETLIPEVQDFEGKMAIKLQAKGTLNKPILTGQAQLSDGKLRIPRLGLNINQVKLEGKTDAFNKLNFHMTAHSGEGSLDIQGNTELDGKAGWPTYINVKGESFEASRIPEARVLVSPDLNIKIQKRNIDISGDVHIPYAKLQPKDVTTAARVSDDAVIIGGEPVNEEKWSVFTNVRLTLGERIHFYGFGFEGRFGGNLLLQDEPGRISRGTGELNIIEGRYHAYGQRLEVKNGSLLYTGGPLSNPGIDLRAVRRINDITAGLKVRGTLRKPEVELFSIPAMGQTDALAYLLLGHPIETSSNEEGAMMAKAALALGLSGGDRLARSLGDRFGLDEMRIESSDGGDQASLVMGRYLSPKLYVSYGVGLIEAFNTLTLRYQLSSKWQLKGESGEHHSADLFYTIEH